MKILVFQVRSVLHPSVITVAALIAIYTVWTLFRIKIPGCSIAESIQLKAIADKPCDVYSENFSTINNNFSRKKFYDQKYNIENTDPKFNSLTRSDHEYYRGAQSKEYEDEEYSEEDEEEVDEQYITEEIDEIDSEGEFSYEEEQRGLNRIKYDGNEQEDEQYFQEEMFGNEEYVNEELAEEEDINTITKDNQEDNNKLNDFKIDNNEKDRVKAGDNVLEGDDSYLSSGSSDMWSDDGCLTVCHVSDLEHETEVNTEL